MLEFKEIFTVNNMIIYLIVINLIGFFIMWLDKRRAKNHGWRIPEKTLFLISFFGGSVGGFLSMLIFRHKIRKPMFYFVFGISLVLHICVVIFLTGK